MKEEVQQGKVYKHPDGSTVYILDLNYTEISSFVEWRRVSTEGTLSKRKYRGLAWRATPIKATINVKVTVWKSQTA